MEKLKMHSPDFTQENIAKLAELFPNCVTEVGSDEGKLKKVIDFDQLRQELSDSMIEGQRERYHLNWPGKKESILVGRAPVARTLRPVASKSINFSDSRNIFIEGDNLDALKLLQEVYLNKIRLIYIDPPYNTGRDFIYDDDFSEDISSFFEKSQQIDESGNRLVANPDSNGRFHSDWLSMMYPRLRLARNLLHEEGVVFISIDDNEVHNLRRLCDEVFGDDNFVATVIWQKVFSPKNSAKHFSVDHDYILVYGKEAQTWRPRLLERTSEQNALYKNPDSDPRGPWMSDNLTARNFYTKGIYEVTGPTGKNFSAGKGRYWPVSIEKFHELNKDGRIWWGAKGDSMPRLKRFLSEVSSGRVPQTLWPYKEVGHTQDAKRELMKYVPFENTENVLNSVKPTSLLRRILHLATPPNEEHIVLDFFSGSASTAHAVLRQNSEDDGKRRFIAIQIEEELPKPEEELENIFDIGTTRVANVIKELTEQCDGTLLESDVQDLGFRVFRVDSSNMKDVYYSPDGTSQTELLDQVDNIKEDRTSEDLLFQVLLDWGVDLSLPISSDVVDGKTVFFVDETALAACFDDDVSEALVKSIAKRKPLRAVFRDSGYGSDSTKINVEQIFKTISPETDVKSI